MGLDLMAGPRDEGDENEEYISHQSARLFGRKIWGGLGLNPALHGPWDAARGDAHAQSQE